LTNGPKKKTEDGRTKDATYFLCISFYSCAWRIGQWLMCRLEHLIIRQIAYSGKCGGKCRWENAGNCRKSHKSLWRKKNI
jgi:hypothetical protein